MSDPKTFEFGTFLDVRNCGSSISGYITEPTIEFYDENSKWWVEGVASLNLTDCNRSIQWDFSRVAGRRADDDVSYNLAKMKKVIDALQTFYNKMLEAEAACAPLREKVAAHNEALKKKETT